MSLQMGDIILLNVCPKGVTTVLIPVVLKDGTYQNVFADALNRLLAARKVMAFKRRSGWVMVDTDPVRGIGGRYRGPDRRHREHIRLKNMIH